MEKGEDAFCGRFHIIDNSSLGSDLPGKAIRFKISNVTDMGAENFIPLVPIYEGFRGS